MASMASAQRRRTPRVIQLDELSNPGRLPLPRFVVVGSEDPCPARSLRQHCAPTGSRQPETPDAACYDVEPVIASLSPLSCSADPVVFATAIALEGDHSIEALEAAAHLYERIAHGPRLRHLALLGRVRVLYRLDRHDEAVLAVRRLLEANPDPPMLELGIQWFARFAIEDDRNMDGVTDADWTGPDLTVLPADPAVAARIARQVLDWLMDSARYDEAAVVAETLHARWPNARRVETWLRWIEAHRRNMDADKARAVAWEGLADCARAPTAERADCRTQILDTLQEHLVTDLHRCTQRMARAPDTNMQPDGCGPETRRLGRFVDERPHPELVLDVADALAWVAGRERYRIAFEAATNDAERLAVRTGGLPVPPVPRVAPAQPTVEGWGDYDPALFMRAVRGRRSELQSCGGPRGGATRVHATLTMAGETRVIVRGADAPCVERILSAMRFRPGPDGGDWSTDLTLLFRANGSVAAPSER